MLIDREVIFAEDVEQIFGKRPWKSRSDELIAENERLQKEREAQEVADAIREAEEKVRQAGLVPGTEEDASTQQPDTSKTDEDTLEEKSSTDSTSAHHE